MTQRKLTTEDRIDLRVRILNETLIAEHPEDEAFWEKMDDALDDAELAEKLERIVDAWNESAPGDYGAVVEAIQAYKRENNA